jgi:isoquinoline 1-oxidoreductase beta subunit
MSDIFNVSRRDFLRTGLLTGGGLVLGLHLPALAKGQGPGKKDGPFALNAFVRVGSDDSVSVVVNHSEMGQGIYTSMPMVVAEELDAEWAKVRFEAAPVAAVYNHPIYGAQLTGGSSSTWVEWERVRKAGAAARAMLIAAAAAEWKVEPATCGTEPGHVVHAGFRTARLRKRPPT